MKDKIHRLLNEIIRILCDNEEEYWADIFKKYSIQLDDDYDECLTNLRRLYSGVGSFNDLVLHKNGIPLKKENNSLDLLRNNLYNLLK
ncbi:DUF6966 domain-containing protein [Yersinia pseudotuberculosis]|uniref:DUF6966 domain-containing protein n=1 Tax=Yersinia pseudotuberculosis TaxID=633 RepID=UPI001A9F0651|nr:hypothetical protein [Yersinia pseudotuberculosis]MBO1548980.1 hypothetical protein [Yersinia pseudotuberculosis]MBO1569133.1 hypothetical protein [Yersinia pseudotuberculosis]MBO1584103.1 hypothetical protein [Yersinia pseudotuberculosis]MBO1633183.1 hypothetical protein [Yersinia pseudotuberculosis]